MPNLIGLSETAALAALAKVGLDQESLPPGIEVQCVYDPSSPADGIVISQNAPAGEHLPPTAIVGFVIDYPLPGAGNISCRTS